MVGAYSLRMGAFGADGVGPDGICIDAVYAVWTGSGENACVRVRAGAEVLQRIELERSPFACMLRRPGRWPMASPGR
jgi:sugar lactone lactonase YvrE